MPFRAGQSVGTDRAAARPYSMYICFSFGTIIGVTR